MRAKRPVFHGVRELISEGGGVKGAGAETGQAHEGIETLRRCCWTKFFLKLNSRRFLLLARRFEERFLFEPEHSSNDNGRKSLDLRV